MRRRGVQYKYHHDKKVHFKPMFVPNQWVFVNRTPLASSRNTADGMATARCIMLQPCKAKPFRFKKVHPHTVVIDEDYVPNMVSIHEITATLGSKSSWHTLEPGSARHSDSSQTMSDSPRQRYDRASEDILKKANLRTEYTVESVVGHSGDCRRLPYIARWCEYGSKGDTLEPARNILKHFFVRYSEVGNYIQTSA